MPLRTLLGLLLGNLVWSAHPLLSKYVLADFSPVEGAWLRYTSSLVAFLLFRMLIPKFRSEPFFFARARAEWGTVIAVGGLAFCFAPLLQLTGLTVSRATDNALIIAMEPMMTVLLAWAMLGERISLLQIGSFIVALWGFALLSGVSAHGLQLPAAHLWGDVIILVSLLGEAYYSIGGRKLLERHAPVSIFGLANFAGVILLTALTLFWIGPSTVWNDITHHWSARSLFAIAYLGPLGTAGSYLYWMYALREGPVASLALTLFVQPVFGSYLGYLFLGERLSLSQKSGGVLILIAVFAQTLNSIRGMRVARSSVRRSKV